MVPKSVSPSTASLGSPTAILYDVDAEVLEAVLPVAGTVTTSHVVPAGKVTGCIARPTEPVADPTTVRYVVTDVLAGSLRSTATSSVWGPLPSLTLFEATSTLGRFTASGVPRLWESNVRSWKNSPPVVTASRPLAAANLTLVMLSRFRPALARVTVGTRICWRTSFFR